MAILRTVLICTLAASMGLAEEKSEWIHLFDGTNLDHWQKTEGNWKIEDDKTLSIKPAEGQKGWARFKAYLFTKKQFENFEIEYEYKYNKNGNSGLYFRIGDMNDPVNQGMEVQIKDDSRLKRTKMGPHDHGGVIKTVGPTKNMSKAPDEWNKAKLKVVGQHMEITLNGEKVVDYDFSQNKAAKDKPRKGYIGLQDHGHPHVVHFRSIRIREIK